MELTYFQRRPSGVHSKLNFFKKSLFFITRLRVSYFIWKKEKEKNSSKLFLLVLEETNFRTWVIAHHSFLSFNAPSNSGLVSVVIILLFIS